MVVRKGRQLLANRSPSVQERRSPAATRGNKLTEYELRLACNRIGISFDQVSYVLGMRDTSLTQILPAKDFN